MLYEGAWVAERYTVIEDLLHKDPEAILPVTRQVICIAEALSAADAFHGMYRLKELSRIAKTALEGLDMPCVPTIPTFHTVAELEADPLGPNSNFGTYTNFVNLLDMCGIAVPVPARSDGRPGSASLLAAAGKDADIAASDLALEAAGQRKLGLTGWPFNGKPTFDTATADGPILAVSGAHMDGLPLNHQLTEGGATYHGAATTTDSYRFYALAGDPPARPGLVKGAPKSSASIAVELWSLPFEKVDSFLNTIPAPLVSALSICPTDGRQMSSFVKLKPSQMVPTALSFGAGEIIWRGGQVGSRWQLKRLKIRHFKTFPYSVNRPSIQPHIFFQHLA